MGLLGPAACISRPERGLEPVASSASPSRTVAAGLMKSGRQAMSQGRLDRAIVLFRQVRDNYPTATERPEATLLLAQALEAHAETSAAIIEYRRLVTEYPATPQALLARTKIPELERQLGGLTPLTGPAPIGIYLPARRVETFEERDLDRFQQANINTLVLEVARQNSLSTPERSGAGVYFKTDWAPVVRDSAAAIVRSAHQKRLRVWAALSIRRMDWIDPRLEWFDHRYSVTTGELAVADTVDLLHPAVSEYLLGLLIDLAATGIDGIVVLADPPSTPKDGFGPFARRAYERDVGHRADPPRFRLESSANLSFTPDFWRWVGWKQREHIKVLASILTALRKSYPKLQVTIELHPESITNPRGALAWYAEDLLDLRRYRFDYIAMSWQPGLTASFKPLSEGLNGKRFLLFVESGVRPNGSGFPSGTGLIYKEKRDSESLTKRER